MISIKNLGIILFVCFISVLSVSGEDCGYPGLPANGRFVESNPQLDSEFPHGHVIRFECEDGFVLIGSPQRTCQYNGRWSGSLPICLEENSEDLKQLLSDKDIVDSDSSSLQSYEYGGDAAIYPCGEPDILTAGKSEIIKDKNGFINVVYECENGYRLVGDALRICQEDGQWNGIQPRCVLIEEIPSSANPESLASTLFVENTRNVKNVGEMLSKITENMETLRNTSIYIAALLSFCLIGTIIWTSIIYLRKPKNCQNIVNCHMRQTV